MLTYFRHIRKELFSSAPLRRYIMYATGEILLVMIGILLALQVNNWNENRKERIQEKILLEETIKTLESNCQLLNTQIESIDFLNRSSEIILSALDKNLPYEDSLSIHFMNARILMMNE